MFIYECVYITHTMAKPLWTPDHHTQMCFFNTLFHFYQGFTVIITSFGKTFNMNWERTNGDFPTLGLGFSKHWWWIRKSGMQLVQRSGLCAGHWSFSVWILAHHVFMNLTLCKGHCYYGKCLGPLIPVKVNCNASETICFVLPALCQQLREGIQM